MNNNMVKERLGLIVETKFKERHHWSGIKDTEAIELSNGTIKKWCRVLEKLPNRRPGKETNKELLYSRYQVNIATENSRTLYVVIPKATTYRLYS